MSSTHSQWQSHLQELRKWLHNPDDVLYTILAASVFSIPVIEKPVWLLLVGPSGGLKSEMLKSFKTCRSVVYKTALTPASLCSGFGLKEGEDYSLLPKLNQKTFILTDMATLLDLNPIARDEVFATLREAYDGEFFKPFGIGERKYRSTFNFVSGTTAAGEQLRTRYRALGERFLTLRLSAAPKDHRVLMRAVLETSQRQKEERLCQLMQDFESCLVEEAKPQGNVLSDMHLDHINLLTSLRGVVPRDGYTRQVSSDPHVEMPTRIALQLKAVYISGSYFVPEPGVLVDRLIYDSIAPDRRAALEKLLGIADGLSTTLPKTALHRAIEDLQVLGVVSETRSVVDAKTCGSLLRQGIISRKT